MHRSFDLALPPEVANDEVVLHQFLRNKFRIPEETPLTVRKYRQSIDARTRNVSVVLKGELFTGEAPPPLQGWSPAYPNVSHKPKVVIVGSGPAGLFAALRLIELGLKPVILERGKDVQARRRDLAAINKDHIVNPDSNYCFGEGGAGTYSDGKLYTRATKRGEVKRILEILVGHGADEQILIDTHPHIGTNKLPKIIGAIRARILNQGGEIHYETKATGLGIRSNHLRVITTANGREFSGLGVILATGHSARDIFHLLARENVLIESKPFAMGVRIEHAQSFIDKVQYHTNSGRGPHLPAAAYSLAVQTYYQNIQRGVYSFCMCPGGFIVPSATAPGEIVVNGMSPSRRDSRFANSGIVVAINESDLRPYQSNGPLAGLSMQMDLERKAYAAANGTQAAPAQLAVDFLSKKQSASLAKTSYQPGVTSIDLNEILPPAIAEPLREGLKLFNKRLKGFIGHGAQLLGVESRTSSPVRIPRDKETYEHPYVKGLYPCGEGSGYAGGIMSAAMDGERCAEQLAKKALVHSPI